MSFVVGDRVELLQDMGTPPGGGEPVFPAGKIGTVSGTKHLLGIDDELVIVIWDSSNKKIGGSLFGTYCLPEYLGLIEDGPSQEVDPDELLHYI